MLLLLLLRRMLLHVLIQNRPLLGHALLLQDGSGDAG